MRRETDIAAAAATYLREAGWTVYQEVSLGYGEQRADLVARRDSLLWVVEAKTCLSLDVIGQAARWLGMANLVSVAVPKRFRGYRFGGKGLMAEQVLRWQGIGSILVDGNAFRGVPPHLWRRRSADLERVLCDQQICVGTAGSNRGGYWTPYADTCWQLTRLVEQVPGITMKEAIERIRHHYGSDASARQSVVQRIRAGQIKGLRCETQDRRLRLYPTRVPEGGPVFPTDEVGLRA